MILTGVVIIAFGSILWQALGLSLWYFGSIGLFNILLGIITPKAPGVALQPNASGPVRLIIDKVVVRASIYQLVFLDAKLVMKKLTSRTITVGAGIVFAALGGLVGGLTGFSLEEFLAQWKRDKIRKQNTLTTLAAGDIEILYSSMSQVRLTGTSLDVLTGNRTLIMNFPWGYAHEIAPSLRKIIPANCWVGGSVPRLSGSG
jgi:hypothetical protein